MPIDSGRDKIGCMDDNLQSGGPEIIVTAPKIPMDGEIEERLRVELGECPDVAFAHLPQVEVVNQSEAPQLSLFVWLVPEAVGSLRAALNLVSEAVARALPEEMFLDVLILNSAPELLVRVEEAGCLLVVRDEAERQRALKAASRSPDAEEERPSRRFWPF